MIGCQDGSGYPIVFDDDRCMIRSLQNNYKTKLVVLLIAIFIWFFVITENDYEDVIEISINIYNFPNNKVLLNEIPKTAKVKVKGTGKDLIGLGVSRSTHIGIDLSGVDKAKNFVLDPDDVFLSRSASGLVVQEIISPESLTVILDDFFAKKVPVVSRLKVSSAPGYTAVGQLEFSPDSVIVSGPGNIVRKISAVPTNNNEFSGLKQDLHQVVDLVAPLSRRAKLSTGTADVYLNVQKLLELSVIGVPVSVRNAPENLAVYVVPSTLDLVLEGGAHLLSNVDRNDIIAYVDYNRASKSPGKEFPAVIERPPGVTYRDVSPRTFKLVFEKRQRDK